jgi:serine/threonine protein kinase
MTVESQSITRPLVRIGGGRSSVVYAIGDANSKLCLKQMPLTNGKSMVASARRKAASREICALRLLSEHHPRSIVSFKGASVLSGSISLHMERMDFSLDDLIFAADTRLDDTVIVSLTRGLTTSIKACHDSGIVHRDIKPGNILLGYDGSIKLCDFGLSRKVHSSDSELTECTNQVCSRWYKAVEVLLGDVNQSFAMDIWSLGCIVAELYMLGPIFQGWSDIEQLCIIQSVLGPLDGFSSCTSQTPKAVGLAGVTPSTIPSTCLDFIAKCFEYDPKQRWSIGEASNSLWLVDPQCETLDQAALSARFRGINLTPETLDQTFD